MAIVSETTVVAHPIGEVFDFLADGSSNALWRPSVVNVIFASGPAEHAVWAQSVRTAKGKTVKADYRVTWYDRPGRLELGVVNGPSRPTTSFALRSLGPSSTEIVYAVQIVPRWWPFARSRFGAREADAEAANILNLGSAMGAPRRRSVD